MPYQSKFVLIGYYAENQESGSSDERERWSQDVFDKLDHHITAACEKAGFEPSEEARSMIAILATMAPGTASKTKAGQAVQAYVEYRGI